MVVVRGLLAAILFAAIPFVAVHSLSQEPLREAPQIQQAQANDDQGTEYWPAIYGYKLKVTDTLGALASVAAGIIGALGAALAVYLTLTIQRKDETKKIRTAIITEIAQLARFQLEQLATCQAIYEGRLPIPRNDLPIFMQTPPPTLYLAAAERISRVHRPTLVIAFYIGLVETEKVVNVIVKAPSSKHVLGPGDVQGLGVLLMSQCFLARQILSDAPIPTGKEEALVTQMRTEIIRRLDEQISKSKDVFPTTEEYEQKTVI